MKMKVLNPPNLKQVDKLPQASLLHKVQQPLQVASRVSLVEILFLFILISTIFAATSPTSAFHLSPAPGALFVRPAPKTQQLGSTFIRPAMPTPFVQINTTTRYTV